MMKEFTEHIAVDEIVLHLSDDGSSWARLVINHETNPAWCLALCLLHHDLAERVRITGGKNDIEIHLSKNAGFPKGERCVVQWVGKKCLLQISLDELGYWMRFFLEFVRDGMPSVDHIDFQTNTPRIPAEAFSLVLIAEPAVPPVALRERSRKQGKA